MLRPLFLTWDGPQQTYLQSLFFPIFAGLRARGVDVHVLQLTWATGSQLEPVRAAAESAGVSYASRSVPAALRKAALPVVILYGARTALAQARRHGCDTLFPRSLIPMAMALCARGVRAGLDLVFDADGFMADERLDFGGWRDTSVSYRALRRVERAGVLQSRAVICRTAKARQILSERAAPGSAGLAGKIFVAPNGKSSRQFSPGTPEARSAMREQHGVPPQAPWLVYVGSLGPQYCPEAMFATFSAVLRRRPDARFGCFTFQADLARRAAELRGIPAHAIDIRALDPEHIPGVLAAADLGFALRRESPSQRGVSPIKVAEYLLAGTPLVATHVGDLQEQLGGNRAALLVEVEDPQTPERVAAWLDAEVLPAREQRRLEARDLGMRWFELEACVDTYATALRYSGATARS